MSSADLLNTVLICTVQIFAILNPVSVIPTFLAMAEGRSQEELRDIVRIVGVTIFALMVVFAVLGDLILQFMSISVDDLRFGGGILLMIISMDMLRGMARTKTLEKVEFAVVPISTPLLVGPGTITTVVILSADLKASYGPLGVVIVIAAVAITAALTYLIMRYASPLTKYLGINGIRALGRFMAIIIAATAADMIHKAISDWISEWFPSR